MRANSEIYEGEREQRGPICITKLTLRQRQKSKQKNKFANKVGPLQCQSIPHPPILTLPLVFPQDKGKRTSLSLSSSVLQKDKSNQPFP